MGSESTLNEETSKEANGHPPYQSKEETKIESGELRKKVYKHRNSYLTDLMAVNHLQTVYNISVAVFNLLLLNAVLYYVVAPQVFWKDLASLGWASSGVMLCLKIWLCLHLQTYLTYLGFKTWVRCRHYIHSKLMDSIFLVAFLLSIALMFTATPYAILQATLPPITGFAIMAEQIRIFMKIYSFVRENVPRALQYNPSKDGNQEHHLYPSLKHFAYFLFVPTLIYRDSYPRTKDVSLEFVYREVFRFFACIFIIYCIFMRFVVDVFRQTGVRKFTLPEVTLVYVGSIVTGAMIMFCAFYGILHSWLNIFAELLRFGDREFYQDWWNSTSFSQYYRRWNGVVHDWLYAYVYADTYNLGLNRSVSLVGVFVISAIVHEYWIAISLNFFYPVLMVTYLTIGIVVLFVTKQRTSNSWNTFMWTMLFSGWGVIVILYSWEWFARLNCPKKKEAFEDFFIPRSWDPSCKIFEFS